MPGAGVQRRYGADTVAAVRAVDLDNVVAGAGPDGDAAGEVAGFVGVVCDISRRKADDLGPVHAGGVARQAVGGCCSLVADHQEVTARTGINVERAVDIVEVPAQEIGRRIDVDGGGRRDVDAIIAVM